MLRSKLLRTAVALAASSALAFPAAAAAGPHGKGHHGKPGKRIPFVSYILKGKVKSIDAATGKLVVTINHSNRHGRALRGKDLTIDVAGGARVVTEDHNGDGARNLADLAAGDQAKVKTRMPKRLPPVSESFRTLAKRVIATRPAAVQL